MQIETEVKNKVNFLRGRDIDWIMVGGGSRTSGGVLFRAKSVGERADILPRF